MAPRSLGRSQRRTAKLGRSQWRRAAWNARNGAAKRAAIAMAPRSVRRSQWRTAKRGAIAMAHREAWGDRNGARHGAPRSLGRSQVAPCLAVDRLGRILGEGGDRDPASQPGAAPDSRTSTPKAGTSRGAAGDHQKSNTRMVLARRRNAARRMVLVRRKNADSAEETPGG